MSINLRLNSLQVLHWNKSAETRVYLFLTKSLFAWSEISSFSGYNDTLVLWEKNTLLRVEFQKTLEHVFTYF